MILTISIYQTEDGDRFKVYASAGQTLTEITDQYELVATKTDDGREGFLVVKREMSPSAGQGKGT